MWDVCPGKGAGPGWLLPPPRVPMSSGTKGPVLARTVGRSGGSLGPDPSLPHTAPGTGDTVVAAAAGGTRSRPQPCLSFPPVRATSPLPL